MPRKKPTTKISATSQVASLRETLRNTCEQYEERLQKLESAKTAMFAMDKGYSSRFASLEHAMNGHADLLVDWNGTGAHNAVQRLEMRVKALEGRLDSTDLNQNDVMQRLVSRVIMLERAVSAGDVVKIAAGNKPEDASAFRGLPRSDGRRVVWDESGLLGELRTKPTDARELARQHFGVGEGAWHALSDKARAALFYVFSVDRTKGKE